MPLHRKAGSFPPKRPRGSDMKQCSVCQEEFADKFSFCPVDGTPLDGQIVKAVEPAKPELGATVPPPSQTEETAQTEWVAPSSAAAGTASHAGEYHLTI